MALEVFFEVDGEMMQGVFNRKGWLYEVEVGGDQPKERGRNAVTTPHQVWDLHHDRGGCAVRPTARFLNACALPELVS